MSNMRKLYEAMGRIKEEEKQTEKPKNIGLYIAGDDGSSDMILMIYDMDKAVEALNSTEKSRIPNYSGLSVFDFQHRMETSAVIGMIGLHPPDSDGRCMNAYIVGNSAVFDKYHGMGFGRMLYGLAMVAAYPHPITSDRSIVQKDARNVWKSFQDKPQIKKLPSDKPPYRGEFDNIESPQTEPDDDDCYLQDDPALNKAYQYTSQKNEKLMKQLRNNHAKFEKMVKKKGLTPSWSSIAREVFSDVYWSKYN